MGLQLSLSKQQVVQAAFPSDDCAIVDPAGLSIIKDGPSQAGGASKAVYQWLRIDSQPAFPQDVISSLAPLLAKHHQYGSKHCIHVIGPNFKDQPVDRDQAIDLLSQAYLQVFGEFIASGLGELRLSVISGGLYAGTFKGPQFPAMTQAALQKALLGLSEQNRQHIGARSVELCIFAEEELSDFQAVFGAEKTFETSSFNKHYCQPGTSGCVHVDEFWEVVQDYLTSFYQLKMVPNAQQQAVQFLSVLKQEVETVNPHHLRTPEAHAKLIRNLRFNASWVCVRCWTCAQKDPVMRREWCGLLQEGTRLDAPELFPSLAKIWMTMNYFCVAQRRKGEPPKQIPWPMKDNPQTGEVQWTLFRGSRISLQALQWYEQAIRERTIYRAPMAIATTRKGNFSIKFMTEGGYPEDAPMVQWVFHLDAMKLCVHVDSLEPVTILNGEEEFLFPPYSSFQAQQIQQLPHPTIPGATFYRIDLYVMSDNKSRAQQGPTPDHAIIAPWA